jgi:hypothetical protein
MSAVQLTKYSRTASKGTMRKKKTRVSFCKELKRKAKEAEMSS